MADRSPPKALPRRIYPPYCDKLLNRNSQICQLLHGGRHVVPAVDEEGAGLIVDVRKTPVHLFEVGLDVLDATHGCRVSLRGAGGLRGGKLCAREEANHAIAPAKAIRLLVVAGAWR